MSDIEEVIEQATARESGAGSAAPDTPGAPAHAPDAESPPTAGPAHAPNAESPPTAGPAHAPNAESPPTAGPAEQEPDAEASEVEGDLDELVRTAAQRDEYLALAQRTQADFENYRKRVARESATAAERGVAKLAKELLPALDNLDRALAAAEEEALRASSQRPAGGRPSPSDRGPGGPAEDSLLLEGVRLVRTELSAALARVGVEAYDPAGEQFDPAHHEAMAQRPAEGADSGTVIEVYQPGYRLNGTVIRPARVVVAA
jgi:molecular chaperone GrpE